MNLLFDGHALKWPRYSGITWGFIVGWLLNFGQVINLVINLIINKPISWFFDFFDNGLN
jgi:hypothetical protein